MSESRDTRISIWVPKELRDRLGEYTRFDKPFAKVIEELMEIAEHCTCGVGCGIGHTTPPASGAAVSATLTTREGGSSLIKLNVILRL
jgi:hypothetical protein